VKMELSQHKQALASAEKDLAKLRNQIGISLRNGRKKIK